MSLNVVPLFPSALATGAPLVVTATTSGAAQTLHTAVNETGKADTIRIAVKNVDLSTAVTPTFLIGGVVAHGSDAIPANTTVYLTYSLAGGLVLGVYASAASKLNISVADRGFQTSN